MKKIKILIISILSMYLYSCNSDNFGDNNNFSLKITNPLDGYSVGIGSKVVLTVFSDEFTPDNVKFYIDNTLLSTNYSSDSEQFLFNGNKGYVWNVNGISIGNHTLKADAYSDGNKVATKEITLNFTQPKWKLLDLSPYVGNNYHVNEVFLLNETTGWIHVRANNTNYLLKTTDKGLTWQVISNDNSYWENFAFSDANNGVAIEYYGDNLFKLTNQGQNTTEFTAPPYSYSNVRNLAYTQNPDEITMVATRYSDEFECVYRINTLDFSITQITPVVDNGSTSGAFQITFKGSKGIISSMEKQNGNQYIYTTNDNGLSWQSKELAPPTDWYGGSNNYQIENAAIFDDNNIWLVGGDTSDYLSALIYRTSDGGNNWIGKPIEQKLPFYVGSFTDIALLSPTEAYAISAIYSTDQEIIPKMYHTTDGGNNWQPVYEVSPNNNENTMSKIEMKGTNFGIAFDDAGEIYRYSNN